MADSSGTNQNSSAPAVDAASIAKIVVIFTLSVITVLSAIVLYAWRTNDDMIRYVFASIIPLLGSWMGTVLAYYFSRENLAAATQSVRDLTQAVTGQDKLKAVLVKDKMIPLSGMKFITADDDNSKLTALKDLGVERIPVLSTKFTIRYLIYKAMIDKYLATFAPGGARATSLTAGKTTADLTVNDIVNSNPDDKKLFVGSFGFVPLSGTLADVKAIMANIDKCADVFVTNTGTKDEPIFGWITDDIIIQNSKP